MTRNRPAGQDSQSVLPVPALDLPLGQLEQAVSSLSPAVPYQPFGQVVQEATTENGLWFGEDIYEPEGQHPKRPVDVKKLFEDNDCHLPPHNVRVKPLC